jgi:single-stranded DNA-specific DHH superfamily exonuclease
LDHGARITISAQIGKTIYVTPIDGFDFVITVFCGSSRRIEIDYKKDQPTII